jgi:hypothetical protein
MIRHKIHKESETNNHQYQVRRALAQPFSRSSEGWHSPHEFSSCAATNQKGVSMLDTSVLSMRYMCMVLIHTNLKPEDRL